MGNNLCIDNSGPDRQRSLEIEDELRKYKTQIAKEKKILLLGPALPRFSPLHPTFCSSTLFLLSPISTCLQLRFVLPFPFPLL